jgi:hypothetical protein
MKTLHFTTSAMDAPAPIGGCVDGDLVFAMSVEDVSASIATPGAEAAEAVEQAILRLYGWLSRLVGCLLIWATI